MDKMSRKNIRLEYYDYSQNGAYFITICVKDKHQILWAPDMSQSVLSKTGSIVQAAIQQIPIVYPYIVLDNFTIMPNHIHLLMTIESSLFPKRTFSISTIINQFKGYVTKQLGYSIWQKLFYDHIIRNVDDYRKVWQYIEDNPAKWDEDCYYHR